MLLCWLTSLCVFPEGTRCNGFQCSNHTCLPATAHCNGIQECSDGADEHNCGEWSHLFRMHSGHHMQSQMSSRKCGLGSDRSYLNHIQLGATARMISKLYKYQEKHNYLREHGGVHLLMSNKHRFNFPKNDRTFSVLLIYASEVNVT